MFGFGKKQETKAEPTVRGWPERELNWFADRFRSNEPHLSFIMRGFRQGLTLEGEKWAYNNAKPEEQRSQFDGLLCQKNDFVGSYGSFARVEGSFEPVSSEHAYERLAQGEVGRLSITTLDNGGGGPFTPLIEIRFWVRNDQEEATIQAAWRSAFASNGVYLNATFKKVPDVDAWIEGFREKGYSTGLPISRIFMAAESGKSVG